MATIICDDGVTEAAAEAAAGTLLLEAADLAAATGWSLEPEGLCRGDVCVPTKSRPELRVGDRVDLRVMAELLQRSFAIDDASATAVLGGSYADTTVGAGDAGLADLVLHDADGVPFAWKAIGRKKKLLVAWASW